MLCGIENFSYASARCRRIPKRSDGCYTASPAAAADISACKRGREQTRVEARGGIHRWLRVSPSRQVVTSVEGQPPEQREEDDSTTQAVAAFLSG